MNNQNQQKITPEQAPEQPTPTQEPIKKSKPKWLIPVIVVVGVIVLGLIAWGGYELFKPAPTELPEAEEQPLPEGEDEFAGWKTYKNEKYGYEFKHPDTTEWIFKVMLTSKETEPLHVIREEIIGGDIKKKDYAILVSTWDNSNKFSLKEWLRFKIESIKSRGFLGPVVEDSELVSNYMVAGVPAFRSWNDIYSKEEESGKCGQACPILSIYFVYKDKAYKAELQYYREVDEESQRFFELFLSTFKFIEPNEFAVWKTYRNEEYGFELTLADAWRGYKTAIRSDLTRPSIKYIDFMVPINDPIYGDGSGYAAPFSIAIYPVDEWAKEQQEEGPKSAYIAENDTYVFSYGQWQDPPLRVVLHVDFETNQILSTFKFIE